MGKSKSINIRSKKWKRRRDMKILRRLAEKFSPMFKAAILGGRK